MSQPSPGQAKQARTEPTAEQAAMMKAEPQREHQWLHKLVGEWTYETDVPTQEGGSPTKATGAERVRTLGGLWVLAEGEGEMPGGEKGTTLMTLGYDPVRKRFTGTWIGSMMTHMWQYDGALDPSERVLTLDSEGPSMSGDGMSRYQDVIEFKSDDHRTLTARVQGADGKWQQFMTVDYRRKR
jgi:Protein of unknown function (DUF1579)